MEDDPRVVLEAYPALVARPWIGNRSDKTDTVKEQTVVRQSARGEILSRLCTGEAVRHFGFNVDMHEKDANLLIRDGTGDRLDSLLCAVQAGWAFTQRDRDFGIPAGCDPREGWIVDPLLGGG